MSKYQATFSRDRKYRYVWETAALGIFGPLQRPLFLMLNPSTADENQTDPTLRRCIGFAKQWGCDGIVVGNLFAFRTAYPDAMFAQADPVGPDNDHILPKLARAAPFVVCGWGAQAGAQARVAHVLALLQQNAPMTPLKCLGFTKGGHPRHPLYVPKAAMLQPYPRGDMSQGPGSGMEFTRDYMWLTDLPKPKDSGAHDANTIATQRRNLRRINRGRVDVAKQTTQKGGEMRISDISDWVTCETMALHDPTSRRARGRCRVGWHTGPRPTSRHRRRDAGPRAL